MAPLSGSKTHANLKAAFAEEAMANRRLLHFARRADTEGEPDTATLFREIAEAETGHAFGHLDFLREVGDPCTDLPIGDTGRNLRSALAGERHKLMDMYAAFAEVAREEGLDQIAEWFETLQRAEREHAGRLERAIESRGAS